MHYKIQRIPFFWEYKSYQKRATSPEKMALEFANYNILNFRYFSYSKSIFSKQNSNIALIRNIKRIPFFFFQGGKPSKNLLCFWQHLTIQKPCKVRKLLWTALPTEIPCLRFNGSKMGNRLTSIIWTLGKYRCLNFRAFFTHF